MALTHEPRRDSTAVAVRQLVIAADDPVWQAFLRAPVVESEKITDGPWISHEEVIAEVSACRAWEDASARGLAPGP
ncbi:hypothetical protein WMF30_40400 [Sorangium sp. So ce134]